MKRKHLISQSILWASAIVASAIVGAPAVLSTVLLPALAVGSLFMIRPAPGGVGCRW